MLTATLILFVSGCATNTAPNNNETVCVWGKVVRLTDAEIEFLRIEALRDILDNNDQIMAICSKQ